MPVQIKLTFSKIYMHDLILTNGLKPRSALYDSLWNILTNPNQVTFHIQTLNINNPPGTAVPCSSKCFYRLAFAAPSNMCTSTLNSQHLWQWLDGILPNMNSLWSVLTGCICMFTSSWLLSVKSWKIELCNYVKFLSLKMDALFCCYLLTATQKW